VNKRDEFLLLRMGDKILAKDPKTQGEISWEKKRQQAIEARYERVRAKRRKPGLLDLQTESGESILIKK
jgi:hypothetical protein